MAALSAATAAGIRTVLVTTITRHNVRALRHVLELAKERGVLAAFQPIKPYYKRAVDIDDLLAEPGEMQRAIRMLDDARQDGYKETLRNTQAGLEHIGNWPSYGPLKCWAGRIFDRTRIDEPLPSCLDLGLERALGQLPDPECTGCGFCGALELNLAMSLDWRVASTIARLVR
jgi:MoaA/NifB/PqqE/SkfB family radical SAM enzyme